MIRVLSLSSVLIFLTACGSGQPTTPAVTKDDPRVAAEASELSTAMPDTWGSFGINLELMNPEVHPGDNFFHFVNGAWLDRFEMPADRSRYGTFTLLAEKSEFRVRKIIEDLAADAPEPTTMEGKVAAVFNAFMDTVAIEAAGLDPARPYLDRIAAIESRDDLVDVFASNGFGAPIGGWVDIDSKQTDRYAFWFTQAGLGLGDRDYYLVDTDKNLEYRAAYKKMLSYLLTEAGLAEADQLAAKIVELETRIAGAHWDRTAGRNRDLTYNKMTRDELISYGGTFPTARLLDGLGLGNEESFIVRQVTPTAEEIEVQGLNDSQVEKLSGGGIAAILDLAAIEDLDSWKAWLTAQFLIDHAGVLPQRIDDAVFEFYGRTLRGQESQRERWKRAVSAVESSLGEAVGKVYADRHFPAENKAAMDELVINLRRAMAANLDDIEWMSETTKAEARDKLSKFTPKIGYPEVFETYEDLVLGNDALANQLAVSEWSWQDQLSKLGGPIDRTEWFMLPQTVNAYYSPNRNEIVFPAAILQPPFFNLAADPAVNYGAIGGVIGHEIGHGFDDQGSRSDGDGILRNWWTDEDRANFEELTGALVEQYNGFCPLDDGETCVNGALGLGENIGDLGGLSMAYRAYQFSLNGEEAPVLNGFTGDQRFFMAWAQVWRNSYRDDALRQQMIRGPHSPPRYRANGIVRNFDEWYEAFGVTEEHALYLPPEERIRIW